MMQACLNNEMGNCHRPAYDCKHRGEHECYMVRPEEATCNGKLAPCVAVGVRLAATVAIAKGGGEVNE
jgi:hypothetical protein